MVSARIERGKEYSSHMNLQVQKVRERGTMVLKAKHLIVCLIGCLALMTGMCVISAGAMETEDCLECHDDYGAQFAGSAHAEEGCEACHSVTDDHPDDGETPGKESCETCHEDTNEAFAGSIHGESAVCTDCHNPHVIKGLKPGSESCNMCHEDTYEEYAGSLHAKNASCVDCHNVHGANSLSAASDFDKNELCVGCHKGVGHSEWLPREKLHMQGAPCISCHTDSKGYVINMYVEKKKDIRPGREGIVNPATFEDLSKMTKEKGVQSLIDNNSDGSITLAELREFNLHSEYKKDVRLWSVLAPKTVSHNYGIFHDRRDCSFCHASGPKAMKTSFVAFPNQDGTYSRVSVEQGAPTDMLFATPDFYMIGSGRNDILSLLGLAIILGGAGAAMLHGTFRLLTRKNRRKH